MKCYIKETVIIAVQILLFYIFPIFAIPIGAMGMVFFLILSTFTLSLLLGILSENKIKFLYPIVVAIVFLPTVFIYYNESALIHSLWYLAVSAVGLVLGSLINLITKR